MNIEQLGFIIGLAAAALTTISFLPQVIKVFKTKQTKDLSFATFFVFSVSLFLWFVYGILIGELPIILANGITFLLTLSIIIMKIKYG